MIEIYLIHAIGSDFYKIGSAKDVRKRLCNLQTACPFALKLLSTRDGDIPSEQAIHSHLKAFHVRGEWFLFASPPQAMYYFAEWKLPRERKRLSYLAEQRRATNTLDGVLRPGVESPNGNVRA